MRYLLKSETVGQVYTDLSTARAKYCNWTHLESFLERGKRRPEPQERVLAGLHLVRILVRIFPRGQLERALRVLALNFHAVDALEARLGPIHRLRNAELLLAELLKPILPGMEVRTNAVSYSCSGQQTGRYWKN
jgi:hypothetical protein